MDQKNVPDAARIGLKVTRTALRLSVKLTVRAVGGAIKVAQARAASKSAAAPAPPAAASPTLTPAAPVTPPPAPTPSAAPLPPQTPSTRAAPDAKTIDDADPIVAEFAEPGAADGAGAQLHLEAPWEGYDTQNVETVNARIAEADAAELAVLELYEQAHKQRKTVLAAAQRRLKQLSPTDGA